MTSAQTRSQTIAKLSTTIPQIFNEAQKPNTVLIRLSVSLRKIQELCSLNTPPVRGEPHDIDQTGEEAFNNEYIRNVNKILPIRRKEPHADNIVRFVATFLQFTQKQDYYPPVEGMDEEDQPETISSRFVKVLITHILKGLCAKSLPVRLRCCQIIALSVSCLGEVDEDLYYDLQQALYTRIKDKETAVRIQAVTALTRLQPVDGEADDEDARTIVDKLTWILRHDASAEVRRVVILNLEMNKRTIPYLIERARDVDGVNRRLVIDKRLSQIEDFQQIPTDARFKLIKWGLSDREKGVRAATGKMIAESWIKQADQNLLEFLERMDIMEGVQDGVSEKMLTCLLELRMSSMCIKFDDQFWENLSPESAFLAHVYVNVLKSKKMEEQLDDVLPEVTRHSFYIQHYNNLWHQASSDTEGDYEFIVAQMLGVAKKLDYADEVGRRQMYAVLRKMILEPDLPDDHLEVLVDLISLTSMDEPDFTRIIIDVISDIQDEAEADNEEPESSSKRFKLDGTPFKEKESDEPAPEVLQMKLAKLKCLSICKFMLQICEESLQVNSTIYGLMNQLVVPAVQSKEVVLREEGLHCLGLVCHLDKEIAMHNINLFVHCLKNGHDELKTKALKIIFDMIMKYGYADVSEKIDEEPIFFEQCMDSSLPEILYITSEGLAKLILSRSYMNNEVLKLLVVLYFFPTTINNNKLQQCLTYFFPAYCHSNVENQKTMASLAIIALKDLIVTYLDLDETETMVELNLIADMLAHWTDPHPLKAYQPTNIAVDMSVQGTMAVDILRYLQTAKGGGELARKTSCYLLTKLYLDELKQETMGTILEMAETINKECPISEPLPKKQFHKVINHIREMHHKLESMQQHSATTNTTTPSGTREESVSSMASTTIATLAKQPATESTSAATTVAPEILSHSTTLPSTSAELSIEVNDDANIAEVADDLGPDSDSSD